MNVRRKVFAAFCGFIGGVLLLPLVVVAWPFIVAAFCFNEQDGGEM